MANAKNIPLNKALPAVKKDKEKKGKHVPYCKLWYKLDNVINIYKGPFTPIMMTITISVPFIVQRMKSAIMALFSPHVDLATQDRIVKGFNK